MRKKPPPRWLQAARERGAAETRDWLSRALSRAGVLPLEQAQDAIEAGRVRLEGRVMTQPLAPVSLESRVELDGVPVSLRWSTRVLMLHKPAGVVTHGTDPQRIGTVFDVLSAALPLELHRYGWHAVGRLDRDTTGLLLFTNDPTFVGHATSPSVHLEKRYLATVGAVVTEQALERLRAGLDIGDDSPTLPAKAEARGERSVALTLTEGRYHQVKRMLGEVGLPVLSLHREAVGALELDTPVSTVREVTATELRERLRFEPSV